MTRVGGVGERWERHCGRKNEAATRDFFNLLGLPRYFRGILRHLVLFFRRCPIPSTLISSLIHPHHPPHPLCYPSNPQLQSQAINRSLQSFLSLETTETAESIMLDTGLSPPVIRFVSP